MTTQSIGYVYSYFVLLAKISQYYQVDRSFQGSL